MYRQACDVHTLLWKTSEEWKCWLDNRVGGFKDFAWCPCIMCQRIIVVSLECLSAACVLCSNLGVCSSVWTRLLAESWVRDICNVRRSVLISTSIPGSEVQCLISNLRHLLAMGDLISRTSALSGSFAGTKPETILRDVIHKFTCQPSRIFRLAAPEALKIVPQNYLRGKRIY